MIVANESVLMYQLAIRLFKFDDETQEIKHY